MRLEATPRKESEQKKMKEFLKDFVLGAIIRFVIGLVVITILNDALWCMIVYNQYGALVYDNRTLEIWYTIVVYEAVAGLGIIVIWGVYLLEEYLEEKREEKRKARPHPHDIWQGKNTNKRNKK